MIKSQSFFLRSSSLCLLLAIAPTTAFCAVSDDKAAELKLYQARYVKAFRYYNWHKKYYARLLDEIDAASQDDSRIVDFNYVDVNGVTRYTWFLKFFIDKTKYHEQTALESELNDLKAMHFPSNADAASVSQTHKNVMANQDYSIRATRVDDWVPPRRHLEVNGNSIPEEVGKPLFTKEEASKWKDTFESTFEVKTNEIQTEDVAIPGVPLAFYNFKEGETKLSVTGRGWLDSKPPYFRRFFQANISTAEDAKAEAFWGIKKHKVTLWRWPEWFGWKNLSFEGEAHLGIEAKFTAALDGNFTATWRQNNPDGSDRFTALFGPQGKFSGAVKPRGVIGMGIYKNNEANGDKTTVAAIKGTIFASGGLSTTTGFNFGLDRWSYPDNPNRNKIDFAFSCNVNTVNFTGSAGAEAELGTAKWKTSVNATFQIFDTYHYSSYMSSGFELQNTTNN